MPTFSVTLLKLKPSKAKSFGQGHKPVEYAETRNKFRLEVKSFSNLLITFSLLALTLNVLYY